MNGRIIKSYIEMKNSQQQNTPLVKTNPKIISGKAKRCLGKVDKTPTIQRQ